MRFIGAFVNRLFLDSQTLEFFAQKYAEVRIKSLPRKGLQLSFLGKPLFIDLLASRFNPEKHEIEFDYKVHFTEQATDVWQKGVAWIAQKLQNRLPLLLRLAERFGVTIPAGVTITETRLALALLEFQAVRENLQKYPVVLHDIELKPGGIEVEFNLSKQPSDKFASDKIEKVEKPLRANAV
ncbi:MAG: hypothetical protein D6814_09445 [Calditrichaeota bacterium]|nr:MAG: hypothetical protein D6814_09445 [Calditrichota bacterium]